MNKVTVIMNSVNNNVAHLREAIQSYLDQPGVEVEIIVSTVEGDTAIDIAKEMGCVIVVSRRPGIYEQINRAIKKATGDFICYASGNDAAMPGKLQIETEMLLKNKKMVCYSAFYQCDENLANRKVRAFHPYEYNKHLKGNFVSDCAMMTREILDKYCPFELRHKNHAYYDLWLRVAEGEGNVFIYNPQPTWLYRVGKDSRHVQRKNDPARIKENEKNRAKMLSCHGI